LEMSNWAKNSLEMITTAKTVSNIDILYFFLVFEIFSIEKFRGLLKNTKKIQNF